MKQIQLVNNRGFALVDDSDFDMLSKHRWYRQKGKNTLYAVTVIKRAGKRVTVSMHRLIMGEPKGKGVDHRDGNGLINQRFNLRACTSSQNGMNQHCRRGSSQYKGVYWNKGVSKWYARIMKDRKSYYLGIRKSEIECARMYDAKAMELFGEFANTNFHQGELSNAV